jgi:hypothetical protein
MKYSVHSTEAEAQEEIARIEAYLGIPAVGTIKYAAAEEVDGQWGFRVKDSGPWKCDHVAANVQFIEEDVLEIEV